MNVKTIKQELGHKGGGVSAKTSGCLQYNASRRVPGVRAVALHERVCSFYHRQSPSMCSALTMSSFAPFHATHDDRWTARVVSWRHISTLGGTRDGH